MFEHSDICSQACLLDQLEVPSSIGEMNKAAFYVDDCLSCTPTLEEAKTTMIGTKAALAKAGFKLTKFVANDDRLLMDIHPHERAENASLISKTTKSRHSESSGIRLRTCFTLM